MKKLLYCLIAVVVVSCGKDGTTTTLNCRLSKKIHIVTGSYSDTSIYTFTGESLSYVTRYSNTSTVYMYNYTKSGSQYIVEYFANGVKTHEGFAAVNAMGFIDTSRITNLNTLLFNNRDKNYYSPDGNLIRAVTDYNSYINDSKRFYSNGNYTFWIYDRFFPLVPLNNTRDSIVFEYYLDKLKKAEIFIFESKYGNMEKNLVKKRSVFNTLNANALKQTWEYEYLTDANGLVTREIIKFIDQPGNVVTRVDTAHYEYTCN